MEVTLKMSVEDAERVADRLIAVSADDLLAYVRFEIAKARKNADEVDGLDLWAEHTGAGYATPDPLAGPWNVTRSPTKFSVTFDDPALTAAFEGDEDR
jgi:hypothetical protein